MALAFVILWKPLFGALVMLATIVVMSIFGGCASTSVERVDVDKTIDLSGRWNRD